MYPIEKARYSSRYYEPTNQWSYRRKKKNQVNDGCYSGSNSRFLKQIFHVITHLKFISNNKYPVCIRQLLIHQWVFVRHDLLICNKNPRFFIRNGVFFSQSIFPSSMIIRDGTFSMTFHISVSTIMNCI